MTSGNFKTFPITSIVVDRGDRQRRQLTNIEELAESIHRVGLINPPVITSDGLLVAGERRLTACRSLGWTSIPVQFVEDLDQYELRCIELDENVKREDLPWQDQCLAMHELHKLRLENEEGWNAEKTAQATGFTSGHVNKLLTVAREIIAGNEKVATADKFSVAHNVVTRNNERKRTSVLANVATAIKDVVGESEEKPPEVIPILNADFHEWQQDYEGPKFNLIHCDFPYGINVTNAPRQNSAIKDEYDDSPTVYWDLLMRLALGMDNVVAESAHLIFWFSMDFYEETRAHLTRMGWKVNPFPLIWHKSDNAGVAPDPQRWPRRTYETAFIGSRGDRKLTQVGARSNSFAYPGSRDDAVHVSEKPRPVLLHFMGMVCDEYSLVLDPTCGSGNSIKVAKQLGATTVLGIEKSETFWQDAIRSWT